MADMYSMLYLPFAMIAWVAAAFCGRKSTILITIMRAG